MSRAAKTAAVAFAALFAAACAGPVAGPPPSTSTGPENTRVGSATRSGRPVDSRDAERLQRIMVPLIRAMDHPRQLSNIKVGIMDDPNINAANAGNGEFYVTRGLLEKANDQQLLGVLAHEIAHEDLNHVAKAQRLGAGLNIGMVLLDQLIPGSSAITPIAGQLISRGYSRREEYQADAHGAELLRRVGSSKQVMIDTLQWLLQMEGGKSGGFFATHPATAERIEALREAK
jgi:Zn-dependent protease with chaperone function